MPAARHPLLPLLAVALLLAPANARAQLVINESGFLGTTLSYDFAKQIEIGVGPDTCLYYGSFDGLKRRCPPAGLDAICDPNLTFPAGIAFSTGGSFGNYMYVADYGVGDIHRSPGCSPSATFASILAPGAIAFPPGGSAYGDYLYACEAFSGPIYRVSPSGTVTSWLSLETVYLKFGPGGSWGSGLYATTNGAPGSDGIVRISSAGAVTPFVSDFVGPEGFDWAFDGDLFATDVSLGEIRRIKPDGTETVFATLPGAADLAYRAGEQALYVVSNQGGFYRIAKGASSGVEGAAGADAPARVSPNPARGACAVEFRMGSGGLTRAQIVDAAGRQVRRLPETWRPAGPQTLAWDGRDDAGAPTRPGTYFVRVHSPGETRTARVTIVR